MSSHESTVTNSNSSDEIFIIPITSSNSEEDSNIGQPTNKFHSSLKTTNLIVGNSSKSYATFGPIAIYYYQGYWLLAPLGAAMAIGVSEKLIENLVKKYPDNKVFEKLHKMNKFTNKVIINYLQDFGLSWETLTSMVNLGKAFSSPEQQFFEQFVKVYAPLLSLPLAGVIRFAQYNESQELGEKLISGKGCNLFVDMIANGLKYGTSFTSLLSLLQRQTNLIAKNSLLIPCVTSASALLGVIVGTLKQFPNNKKAKKIVDVFEKIQETMGVNPALALWVFELANNLYAAATPDHMLPEWYFYLNMAVSGFYLVSLTTSSIMKTCNARVEEVSEDDSINENTTLLFADDEISLYMDSSDDSSSFTGGASGFKGRFFSAKTDLVEEDVMRKCSCTIL